MKSPDVAILEILRVVVPVFCKVTTLTAPFAPIATLPHVRDAGVSVTVGPLPVIVSVTLVFFVMLPETPVTVIVEVPNEAFAATVRVRALEEVAGFGLNDAATPLGTPEALIITLPVNPFAGTTAITLPPELPGATVSELGFAVRLNVGGAATVRLRVVLEVRLPEIPEIVIVDVPRVAVAVAVKVSVLVDEVGFGLNPAVTPLGKPEALKVGLPLNPFTGTTVTVVVF